MYILRWSLGPRHAMMGAHDVGSEPSTALEPFQEDRNNSLGPEKGQKHKRDTAAPAEYHHGTAQCQANIQRCHPKAARWLCLLYRPASLLQPSFVLVVVTYCVLPLHHPLRCPLHALAVPSSHSPRGPLGTAITPAAVLACGELLVCVGPLHRVWHHNGQGGVQPHTGAGIHGTQAACHTQG